MYLQKRPADDELAAELGAAKGLWDRLVAELAQEHGVSQQEWKCYSRKAGWTLRLKHNGRAIVYLTPGSGSFTAGFALGEKAMQAASRCRLPRATLQLLKTARRYAEGSAVRIVVRGIRDLAVVKKLVAIKLVH